MKFKAGHFIPLPKDFTVSVPSQFEAEKHKFTMSPSGIYVTWQLDRGWLQYAGEQASKACLMFEIPTSPAYLRKLSKAFMELADKIQAERD